MLHLNKIFLIVIFISTVSVLSQTQIKIEWPYLADSPWPFLRGDMQGTGRSEYIGPKTSDANIKWIRDLPLGIPLGPTIGYNDILFFGTLAVDSDGHNQFYAYNPDGTEYWIFETDSWAPNENPALITKDSTVYMVSNAGKLYAFSQDGILKWGSFINRGIGSAQITMDKQGNIFSFNLDTLRVLNPQGETILLKHFEKIGSSIIFSPDGNTIYFKTGYWPVISDTNYLNAADLQGNIKWRYRFSESNMAPVTVDNEGNIYVYGNDSLDINKVYLYALTEQGAIKWKYPIRGYYNGNSVTIDREGNIIFYCSNDSLLFNYIVSLNYYGELNWKYLIEPGLDPFYSVVDHGLVCDAEGNIFFGLAGGNYFYALNKWGELLWKLTMFGYEYISSPAIGSDGTLYIGTSLSTFFQNHIKNLIAISDKPNSVEEDAKPIGYNLEQNYPNPFNPITKIRYSISQVDFVTLKIYDILGKEITTLVNEDKALGHYEIDFNATKLPSGIYVYQLRTSNFISSKKMLLLK